MAEEWKIINTTNSYHSLSARYMTSTLSTLYVLSHLIIPKPYKGEILLVSLA